MTNMQDLSSNLLLVGFVLISLCCLYLLYSNFTKVREINELKCKVEDLKNIFFNQQKHNDETYIKIMNMLQEGSQALPENNTMLDLQLNIPTDKNTPTKLININSTSLTHNILNKYNNTNNNENNDNDIDNDDIDNDNDDTNKTIILDLDDLNDLDDLDNLDNLDELDNNIDNDIDNDDIDIDNDNDDIDNNEIDNNEIHNKNNIFNISQSINDINLEIFDDVNSITTDPIIDDIDNIDDLNTLENLDIIENLDNMDDLDNIDDLDNLDDLDDLDLNTKLININFDSSLSDTIINTNTNTNLISETNLNTDIKSVLFNDIDNQSNTFTNETIELDKLLSGEIKKVDLSECNINTNTNNNSNNDTEYKNYKIEDLQKMSIKQLKDIAKTNNIKSTGNKTKIELIDLLTKN